MIWSSVNNYDLTDLTNAQHNANWSVEEYAAAYQDNVDMINALQSGSLSSFDAGKEQLQLIVVCRRLQVQLEQQLVRNVPLIGSSCTGLQICWLQTL